MSEWVLNSTCSNWHADGDHEMTLVNSFNHWYQNYLLFYVSSRRQIE